jgi:hypothetical protein
MRPGSHSFKLVDLRADHREMVRRLAGARRSVIRKDEPASEVGKRGKKRERLLVGLPRNWT